MPKRARPPRRSAPRPKSLSRRDIEREAAGAVAGAALGAAVGSAAGPPGAAAGAVIGAAVGALAERTLGRESDRQAFDRAELDEEIGVISSDLGAPNLLHPPARVGLYSRASLGAGGNGGETPASGPMSPPSSR